MRRAIRDHRAPFAIIVAFAVMAMLAGVYILRQQRTQLPFTDRYDVRVAFTDTAGLVPGLGQPALVAGVRVGAITDAKVVDGRSVVTLSIDRAELPHVYADATATLRPRTALQDLQVELVPGTARSGVLPAGRVIDVARTDVPVHAENLLRALDGDTRQYLTALLSAVGSGLDGRGGDLRALYRAVGPTADQVAELSRALNRRRDRLARVVHALSALAVAAGDRDDELRRIVDGGSRTLRAMAGEDAALRRSLALLPGTLRDTRRALSAGRGFADEAGPALAALRPVARELPEALRATRRLSAVATPSLRDAVRPTVRAAAPILERLPQTGGHLNDVTPDLSTAFKVLEGFVNELAYNDDGRAKGFAHWIAWAIHNSLSLQGAADGNGQVIRGSVITSCSAGLAAGELGAQALGVPQLDGLVDAIGSLARIACPGTDGVAR